MFEDVIDIGVPRDMSCDELWEQSRELVTLRTKLAAISEEKAEQWKNAQDRDADWEIRDALWSEYEDMYRHYRIVSAWANVIYSLHTFMEVGCNSPFLDEAMTVASTSSAQTARN